MASDITARSRSGSIAGFVTWAKAWRRKAATASGAIGVSSPMLQIASCASVAIGRMTCLTISESSPSEIRSRSSAGDPSATGLIPTLEGAGGVPPQRWR
jgi:hypothetical protein